LRVKSAGLSPNGRLPVYRRDRTFYRTAQKVAKGHNRTHAVQQWRHYSITSSAQNSEIALVIRGVRQREPRMLLEY
jgi:hypothetical protein